MLEMFPKEVMFLIFIAIVWIIVAIIMDFRKREVENWWNFSLIAVVLAYRAFVSVEQSTVWYFLWGLIGLGAGFILGNVLYYARMFAGGDAKLLMALGAMLPLSLDWRINFDIFLVFIICFFIGGAVYGTIYSLVLMKIYFKEFKREYKKQYGIYRNYVIWIVLAGILGLVISLIYGSYIFAFLSVLIGISPILMVYAKSLEESCMIAKVSYRDLTVGDWLVKAVKVGRKTIKPDWEGVSESELRLIQKNKVKGIWVKHGIPYTPAFLLGIIGMIYIMYNSLFAY